MNVIDLYTYNDVRIKMDEKDSLFLVTSSSYAYFRVFFNPQYHVIVG